MPDKLSLGRRIQDRRRATVGRAEAPGGLAHRVVEERQKTVGWQRTVLVEAMDIAQVDLSDEAQRFVVVTRPFNRDWQIRKTAQPRRADIGRGVPKRGR